MKNTAISTISTVSKNSDRARKDALKLKINENALLKVAAHPLGDTKTAIIAALRAGGVAGNAANIEHVQTVRDKVNESRRKRRINLANSKITNPISELPKPSGRPAIRLPAGTPLERITELREQTIIKYIERAFRNGGSGGTWFTVDFAEQTSDVNYSVSLGRNYNVYGGAYKGWSATVDKHNICVPLDWRHRVERKGLALLSGMLTLDALPMEAPAGIELYAAAWASQGRGYDVKTERGFIAVGGGESFHGETKETAIAGLLRKCKIAKKNMATIADLSSSVEAFISIYANCAVVVSLDDARKSGSCEYGIRSWCESVGIDIGRVHVSIAELLEGFRRMPLTEVRRAVLHAVRQNRRICSAQ